MLRRDALAATALSAARVLGANDRVRVGLIGCGGRGRYVSRLMAESPGVEFIAVADVYARNAAAARDWAGPRCAVFPDFRRLLEQKDVDAVIVATPDHWHAAAAVLACAAGKHVYVEKPLAYSIREGRAIVDAAQRYSRIVQPGMQHRSSPHFAEAAEIVQSGKLGKVHFVRVWNSVNMVPRGIGRVLDEPVPGGLDWDMYCGPAPLARFNRKRFLSTYRWFWDYSGGYITDFGTHRFDTVHQIMGVEIPRTAVAAGGRFEVSDAGEMPDVLTVTYEYPGFILVYDAVNLNGFGLGLRTPGMKYYNARGPFDRPNGMAFYGTNGTLLADRVGYELFPELASSSWPPTPDDPSAAQFRMERKQVNVTDATGPHARAFPESIRGLRKPPASILSGHRATTIAHLGNISYHTGLKLKWDAVREDFDNQPEASKHLARVPRKPWDLIPSA
ncbi:MAG: Gfo/Idh/MocA family oxidoreductase [Acidobacteria bacterium]|nr:Gfo/Idh/MocA family oxidoreductase [Acidobacteriota bacterium]